MDAISFQNCPKSLRKLVWHPTTEKHACPPKHHAARVSSLVANSAGPGQIWISICNIAVDFRMGTNETGKRVRAIAIDQKSVKMPVPFCGPKWCSVSSNALSLKKPLKLFHEIVSLVKAHHSKRERCPGKHQCMPATALEKWNKGVCICKSWTQEISCK